MPPLIDFQASPHHSGRNGMSIVTTVIHTTGSLSMRSSVSWAQNPISRASWHYIVDRDGSIGQQVPLARAAWHAGMASAQYAGRPNRAVNEMSIGIELVNLGQLVRKPNGVVYHQAEPMMLRRYTGPVVEGDLVLPGTGPEFPDLRVVGPWEPFPEPQLLALEALLGHLRTLGYTTACDNLVGHYPVALPRGRKNDPGLFPWDRFAPRPRSVLA